MDRIHHQIGQYGVGNAAAGGSDCREITWPPGEEQQQLDVFWYPAGASYLQQKVARFLVRLFGEYGYLPGNLSGYLAQFWAPFPTGTGETVLSVWEQPVGASRQLCSGLCQYRNNCISYFRPASAMWDPVSLAFECGMPQYTCPPQQQYYHQFGIISCWALPLVEPSAGGPIGVLEFVSLGDSLELFHARGSKLYEEFCENISSRTCFTNIGLFLENSGGHVPTQQYIGESGNSNWGTMEDMCHGALINASEEYPHDEENHTNSASMVPSESGVHVGANRAVRLPITWTEHEQLPVPTNHQILDESFQHLTSETARDDNNAQHEGSKKRKPRMPAEQLRENFGRLLKDVAKEAGVHVSTFKRWCRRWGIQRWPSENSYTMIVMARYDRFIVRFEIDRAIKFKALCTKLTNRFDQLKLLRFRIECRERKDAYTVGPLIEISGTDDLNKGLQFLYAINNKTMELFVSVCV